MNTNALKMKFSINDSVTFTEEILNEKLHFLGSAMAPFVNPFQSAVPIPTSSKHQQLKNKLKDNFK